ncbi:MAG: stage III sporulation protein AB [Clostridia bacterium]|nr:stage III sporulation protein AB [Clostridia bacterium]
MWIKLLLSALIIAFCVLLGWFAAEKYRARKKLFSQLAAFNERFLSELTFSRKPLSVFVKNCDYSGDFLKIVERAVLHEPLPLKLSYLSKEEAGELEEYFTTLGRGDTASQFGYFAAKKGVLAECKATAEREEKSHGELYIKLGLLAGLAFVILIV